MSDPWHSFYGHLRATTPTVWDPAQGQFIVTRYSDVRRVLKDRQGRRDPKGAEPIPPIIKALRDYEGGESHPGHTTMMFLDEPDHGRVRKTISGYLDQRVRHAEALVERIVARQLEFLAQSGAAELVSSYCVPVPMNVIASIIGIPDAMREQLCAWATDIACVYDPAITPEQRQRAVVANEELKGCIEKLADARATHAKDDLISDLVKHAARTQELSETEIVLNCALLAVGGFITTADLIGNGIYLLLSHPEELEKLRAEPALITSAVEEMLRFESPAVTTHRITATEFPLTGAIAQAGGTIISILPAANRDPEVFEDADCFNISRKRKPHLAFGAGSRYCPGAGISRLESAIAIQRLFERFPGLSLAEISPRWRDVAAFRGLQSLDVSFGPQSCGC